MELKDLLIQYEVQNGYDHREMAKMIGVSLSTYYRWLTGESLKLKKGTMDKLAEILDFDIYSYQEETNRIRPILGSVKAGYDLFADQEYEGYVELGKADAEAGDYFLRVKGDSMEGSHIFDGDLVYVKSCNSIKDGQIGVVMIGDEVTIKRVKYKKDLLILEASNPKYEAKFFTPEEIEEQGVKIIGLVKFVRTDFA